MLMGQPALEIKGAPKASVLQRSEASLLDVGPDTAANGCCDDTEAPVHTAE